MIPLLPNSFLAANEPFLSTYAQVLKLAIEGHHDHSEASLQKIAQAQIPGGSLFAQHIADGAVTSDKLSTSQSRIVSEQAGNLVLGAAGPGTITEDAGVSVGPTFSFTFTMKALVVYSVYTRPLNAAPDTFSVFIRAGGNSSRKMTVGYSTALTVPSLTYSTIISVAPGGVAIRPAWIQEGGGAGTVFGPRRLSVFCFGL